MISQCSLTTIWLHPTPSFEWSRVCSKLSLSRAAQELATHVVHYGGCENTAKMTHSRMPLITRVQSPMRAHAKSDSAGRVSMPQWVLHHDMRHEIPRDVWQAEETIRIFSHLGAQESAAVCFVLCFQHRLCDCDGDGQTGPGSVQVQLGRRPRDSALSSWSLRATCAQRARHLAARTEQVWWRPISRLVLSQSEKEMKCGKALALACWRRSSEGVAWEFSRFGTGERFTVFSNGKNSAG